MTYWEIRIAQCRAIGCAEEEVEEDGEAAVGSERWDGKMEGWVFIAFLFTAMNNHFICDWNVRVLDVSRTWFAKKIKINRISHSGVYR